MDRVNVNPQGLKRIRKLHTIQNEQIKAANPLHKLLLLIQELFYSLVHGGEMNRTVLSIYDEMVKIAEEGFSKASTEELEWAITEIDQLERIGAAVKDVLGVTIELPAEVSQAIDMERHTLATEVHDAWIKMTNCEDGVELMRLARRIEQLQKIPSVDQKLEPMVYVKNVIKLFDRAIRAGDVEAFKQGRRRIEGMPGPTKHLERIQAALELRSLEQSKHLELLETNPTDLQALSRLADALEIDVVDEGIARAMGIEPVDVRGRLHTITRGLCQRINRSEDGAEIARLTRTLDYYKRVMPDLKLFSDPAEKVAQVQGAFTLAVVNGDVAEFYKQYKILKELGQPFSLKEVERMAAAPISRSEELDKRMSDTSVKLQKALAKIGKLETRADVDKAIEALFPHRLKMRGSELKDWLINKYVKAPGVQELLHKLVALGQSFSWWGWMESQADRVDPDALRAKILKTVAEFRTAPALRTQAMKTRSIALTYKALVKGGSVGA